MNSSTPGLLARPEILALKPYVAATYAEGSLRLNANETPWSPPGSDNDVSVEKLNQYPEERPTVLTAELAQRYQVAPEQTLVTRGSSEAIDLLIRCFCRSGQDEIVICPPTFGMYRVYADVQGAGVVEQPLLSEQNFALNVDAILDNWNDNTKLVFICTPNNPSGTSVPENDLRRLAEGLQGRGIVVIDAAYTEFSSEPDPTALVSQYDNVAVLRTLSKALGLAGVRCGSLIANPETIGLIQRIMPPYSYPTPCQNAVLAALAPENKGIQDERIKLLVSERERMSTAFDELACFTNVWPSDANFILAQAKDAAAVTSVAAAAGILIRDFSKDPAVPGGLRITIGTPDQNNQLLSALESVQ